MDRRRRIALLASLVVIGLFLPQTQSAFLSNIPPLVFSRTRYFRRSLQMSSFVADGSEYSSNEPDSGDDDDGEVVLPGVGYRDAADTPTVELQPVPMSKNAGSRYVAFVWDKQLDNIKGRDVLDLHHDRVALTEDHVMFCRKANLYNDTFNTESMVDILWSFPILASDLKRVIGHVMCMEARELKHAQDLLAREPIVQSLTGGDISNIPFYRWWHIRDYSLRQDDGRIGTPAIMLALDHQAEEGIGNLREDTRQSHLEYLIRSERVIAAGPLHLPTEFKDDPSSLAIGDLVLFNAEGREDAINFVENDPRAKAGLYDKVRVHFYNNLDVTGKFVAEDALRDAPCADMKEALEYWGYPVADEQTPWLNW